MYTPYVYIYIYICREREIHFSFRPGGVGQAMSKCVISE